MNMNELDLAKVQEILTDDPAAILPLSPPIGVCHRPLDASFTPYYFYARRFYKKQMQFLVLVDNRLVWEIDKKSEITEIRQGINHQYAVDSD